MLYKSTNYWSFQSMTSRTHQPGRAVFMIAALCLAFFFGTQFNPYSATGNGYAAPQAQATAAATVAPVVAPGDQTLIELYKKVIPSVVTVFVTVPNDAGTNEGQTPTPEFPFDDGTPFSRGNGSGFIFDTEGHIITNAHVVMDVGSRGRVSVTFSDDLIVPAKIVGFDKDGDIAVIKVETSKSRLIPLPLADSDQLQIGQRVVALGNPFSLYPGTMTEGIISAVNRRFDSELVDYQIPGMIQTDAAINPGNSGGPLVDMAGRVVGINTAIESRVRQSSGVGFAVPSNQIARFAPRLIKDGVVKHAYLGVRGGDLTSELNELIGLPAEQQGVLVSEVVAGGPADKGGLKGATDTKKLDGLDIDIGGDIILSIDGVPTRKFEQLLSYLFTKKDPGDTVTLKVLRDGKEIELQVTLDERPQQ
jgi:S1-C subfamily serine protease